MTIPLQKFIANLHTHDGHSIRDGYSTIEELVSRAKELHYEALALTNHGTVSGLIPFYNECHKQGIKPILGCEMYYVHDINLNESPLYHMLFLAKDLKGYKNLMKLDTIAYRQFYKKPRITMSDIEEFHEGLICSTACLAGVMKQEDPTEDMMQLSTIFNHDLYMELQPHPTEEQKAYNYKVHEWAVKHNHKEIITLDSHYTFKDDAKYHRYWLNLSKESSYYETPTYYLMDTDEINDLMINYHDFHGSIVERCYDNIKEIVDKCNVEIPFGEQHYPNFCADPEAYLRKRLNEGWREKGMSNWSNKKEHIERCNYELKMFNKVGYTNYICIIDDYIRWCKAKGIRCGAGRGSACGSDVMYVIGCTKIDPLKYNLLFERFCNPERTSSADVDVDVQTSRRGELIDYIKSKYGEVYQVRTYGYIKEKSAIRKACQSLGYDSVKTNEVCKASTIDAVADKTVKDLATHFSGRLINYGTHASAVIVCPDDINNYTAVERQKNSKTKEYEYVVCYEFHECEAMGLLKLDILGLQHLDIIDRVVKATGIDYDAIPNEDEKTAKMLRQGKTDGVFQSESAGFTSTLQKMKVSEANDLIATNALYRPGSLDSGTTEEYILRKNGIHPVTYPVPELESALKDTYGLVIYQEQIMAGCRALCGYSLGQADNIRRIIGRKIADEMAPAVEDMKKAAKTIGTPEDAIDGFVKVVEASANYSFNHCLSGDTVLWHGFSRFKQPTIGEMYKIMHDKEYAKATGHKNLYWKYSRQGYGKALSLMDSNTILKKNDIVDIYYRGKGFTYEIETEHGFKVKCTAKHKIPTTNGIKYAEELKIGDEVYTKGGRNIKKNKYTFYKKSNFKKNIPHKGQMGFQEKENGRSRMFDDYKQKCMDEKRPCEICGTPYDGVTRFEMHHKNIDRTHNKPNDLMWLCVSCHKKEHYKMGRTRRGGNGYLAVPDKIVSITPVGEEDVYDIEMKAPYHTLTVNNGFVVSNSHAAAYGVTAWRSAYLKAHYPKAYMTSFLNQKAKDDQFPLYVKAVKDMGITLRPPELGIENCTIVGNSIQLGTNCIKGVGTIDRPVDKNNLRSVMNQYPRNKLEALIEGGALDYFKIKRSVLIGSIDSFKNYFKTIESSHDAINRWKQNTKHKPEYIASKIRYYEDKIKSAKIVGHEDKSFNEPEAEMRVLGFTFGDALRGYDLHLVNNRNVFAGYVQTFRKVKDKKGHRMAFVTLDNGIEFAMFYRQYVELDEGKPYLFGLEHGKRGYIMQSVRQLRRLD